MEKPMNRRTLMAALLALAFCAGCDSNKNASLPRMPENHAQKKSVDGEQGSTELGQTKQAGPESDLGVLK